MKLNSYILDICKTSANILLAKKNKGMRTFPNSKWEQSLPLFINRKVLNINAMTN